MGVSLVQCSQPYAHMDMVLKRELRTKLLKYASLYDLDDMVPSVDTDGRDRAGAKDGWGFVRSWGWRATLSAQDVGVVVGALLEVGKVKPDEMAADYRAGHASASQAAAAAAAAAAREVNDEEEYSAQGEEWVRRFFDAYDALEE
jgi:cell division control protein 45